MLWLGVYVVIAGAAGAVGAALRKAGAAVKESLAAIEALHRDLQPALVRVRTETDRTRDRLR